MSMPDPTEFIAWRGAVVDRRTAAALSEMEHRLGYEIDVIKGHDVAEPGTVSGTTHNGTGVVDLAPFDWKNKLRVAKLVGFAAYHRSPDEGPWEEHEHLILIGRGHGLDPAAQRQVDSYLNGRNGLVSNELDRNPWRPSPQPPVFSYLDWWHNRLMATKVKRWRTSLKRVRERISALEARRKMLKAKIADHT